MPKPKTYQAEPDDPDTANAPEGELDPLIEALLEHLPPRGEPFPSRPLWLQILELALQLIYPEEQPGAPPA